MLPCAPRPPRRLWAAHGRVDEGCRVTANPLRREMEQHIGGNHNPKKQEVRRKTYIKSRTTERHNMKSQRSPRLWVPSVTHALKRLTRQQGCTQPSSAGSWSRMLPPAAAQHAGLGWTGGAGALTQPWGSQTWPPHPAPTQGAPAAGSILPLWAGHQPGPLLSALSPGSAGLASPQDSKRGDPIPSPRPDLSPGPQMGGRG